MKRIFVSSVLVFVVGAVHAGNIIDGNPLYSPSQGRFYNVLTPLEVNSKFDRFVMADEFGYGITDKLVVKAQTSGSHTPQSIQALAFTGLAS